MDKQVIELEDNCKNVMFIDSLDAEVKLAKKKLLCSPVRGRIVFSIQNTSEQIKKDISDYD